MDLPEQRTVPCIQRKEIAFAAACKQHVRRGREDAGRVRPEPVEAVEPVTTTGRQVPAEDPVLGAPRPEDR